MKNLIHDRSFFLKTATVGVILFCVSLGWNSPLHIPDTTKLLERYTVTKRDDSGKPVSLFRSLGDDSLELDLIWEDGKIRGLNYNLAKNIPQGLFQELVSFHGAGGGWHESNEIIPKSLTKAYPGLKQQWFLKGYGDSMSWLGTGLYNNRFFLLFLAEPPVPAPASDAPLAIDSDFKDSLSTANRWLKRKLIRSKTYS